MIQEYYFITDSGLSLFGTRHDVEQAVAAGVGVVQYRHKTAGSRWMFNEAMELRRICHDTLFLINDRADIALAVGADGVHLGQSDLPYAAARKMLGKQRIIGMTVHSLEEARSAQAMGADYIGVAPIFSTSTKSDAGQPVGIDGLKEIRAKISIPIVAIGGIDLSNAIEVVAAGADALCAISAVIPCADIQAEIQKFQSMYRR